MKKITLLLFVFAFLTTVAQTTTTGTIQLASNFTVQFDVNGSNNTVTMTMIGPTNRWLGIALDVNQGNSMGSGGEDVVLFLGSELRNASLTGSFGSPSTDTNQDWSLDSSSTSNGLTTVVGSRDLSTSNPNDYVFTTNAVQIPILWAYGSSFALNGHANRGGTQANFVLSTPEFAMKEFEVYPNPTVDELNFEFPDNMQSANVQVYNVLGKQIMQTQLKRTVPKINTNAWASGMYVVQIITDDAVQTKRIIKQ